MPEPASPIVNADARFIDPNVLARIDNLDLIARIAVGGFISGMHRALYLGVSTDFAEHRAYSPGDDVRRIDWRLYARTDRLFIKAFEAETNADLLLALDVSRSMDFATHTLSKLDYARFVAASLTHLAGRQRDRVGLATFDNDLVEVIPPSARHRDTVMRALDRVAPGGESDLGTALRRLAAMTKRRGIVVVLSDFYAQPSEVAAALGELRVRGHDVIALQILDPMERDIGLDDARVLEDLETRERLATSPVRIRSQYRALVDNHVTSLERTCGERGVDFACFETAQPLDFVLYRYLSDRIRRSRVR